jgi:N-acyl-D-amino-acid deacylase
MGLTRLVPPLIMAAGVAVALSGRTAAQSPEPLDAARGTRIGQALTALAESGLIRPDDPVYRKGVRFLLETQLDDGSWHVRSRAIPVQPYFDSEFPHGKDQFISAAATNWATIALTWAVR